MSSSNSSFEENVLELSEELASLAPYGRLAVQIIVKRGLFKKFLSWIKGDKVTKILLLGASGAGKTSLKKLLTGDDPKQPRNSRTTKVREYEGALLGFPVEIIDTPGEDGMVINRQEIISKVKNYEGTAGVINIVSHGIHEGLADVGSAINSGHFDPDYIHKRKLVEIDRLEEWNKSPGKLDWLLTVVSKADLWYSPNNTEIMDYYKTGDYFKSLKSAQYLPGRVLRFSSLNQMFYNQIPMTGYYSDEMRQSDITALIQSIIELSLK